MDYTVHGILQARILEWVAFPFSTGSSQPRDRTQVSCRESLYQLSHKGSPRILAWVAYPFSRGSSQPRNWTGISCIAGGFLTNWAMREAPHTHTSLHCSSVTVSTHIFICIYLYLYYLVSFQVTPLPLILPISYWYFNWHHIEFMEYLRFFIFVRA